MQSLISVGSHHVRNDCGLESRGLGVLIITWNNSLPFCLVHMVLFHVACDRKSHFVTARTVQSRILSISMSSPSFWIVLFNLHRADLVASMCLMTKKKVVTALIKRDSSILPEQQHFFDLRGEQLKKTDYSERKEKDRITSFSSDSLPPPPHFMPVPVVAGVQGYYLSSFSEGCFPCCVHSGLGQSAEHRLGSPPVLSAVQG